MLCEDNIELRPRTNYNILLFLEKIIFEKILQPKKIIVNSSFNHVITLTLIKGNEKEGLFLSNTHTHSKEEIKFKYTICFFFMKDNLVFTDSIERNKEIFLLYGEAVDLYLSTKFKKYKKGELLRLLFSLDLNFLYEYEYPASYEDQKLLADSSVNVRNKYFNYFSYWK